MSPTPPASALPLRRKGCRWTSGPLPPALLPPGAGVKSPLPLVRAVETSREERLMNLTQWQTKPAWSEYEAQLLDRGYEPTWDPETERAVCSARITCCRCRTSPVYVGMTDG